MQSKDKLKKLKQHLTPVQVDCLCEYLSLERDIIISVVENSVDSSEILHTFQGQLNMLRLLKNTFTKLHNN